MLGQLVDPVAFAEAMRESVNQARVRRQRLLKARAPPPATAGAAAAEVQTPSASTQSQSSTGGSQEALARKMEEFRSQILKEPLFKKYGTDSGKEARPVVDNAMTAVRRHQWKTHFDEYGHGVSSFRTKADRDLIEKGVPQDLRARVWMLYSNADNDRHGKEDEYGEAHGWGWGWGSGGQPPGRRLTDANAAPCFRFTHASSSPRFVCRPLFQCGCWLRMPARSRLR